MPTDDNEQQKDTRTEFLKKSQMGIEATDKENAGDDTFTPIYLNSDTTLQTPGEKRKDESIDPQKDDKVEATDTDLDETTFDKMNDEERDPNGGY